MAARSGGAAGERTVYRIGVNLGDVLIDGDDILGDGVNIAARLEGICEPGGVLISGAAYDHVRGRIDADFVDLGDEDLKNIARPVRAYAVKIGVASAAPAPSAVAPSKQGPPRLSLVVLPFANLGGGASPFSKACARPESPNNDRDPAVRREHCLAEFRNSTQSCPFR